MPAVTADTLALPRLARLAESQAWRSVVRVVTAERHLEGEGFAVRRPFPSTSLAMADPFLLLDHMGEVDYAPGEAKGTPWHPHRGFETVTYIMDGAFEHQDSTGGGGLITDGATQWMTAGSGILHIETPPERLVRTGGLFHGVQLWVNLPAAAKWNPPTYQDIRAQDVSLLSSSDGGALVRVIAGTVAGPNAVQFAGPGRTYTPITYLHATLSPGARLDLPWPDDFSALVYVLAGRGTIGPSGSGGARPLDEGQLGVLGGRGALTMQAGDRQLGRADGAWNVLILGGRAIREPVARYGPFVMNSREEIIQAFEDFQAGRMGQIPASRVPHRTSADSDLRGD